MKKKIVAALLITVMTAGIFSGCGNRMEGDGRVQAAMAAAGDDSNLDSEAMAEPTAEPTPEATAEPTAEPTPEATAEPTPEATAEPTAEPESEATAEPTAEPESKIADGKVTYTFTEIEPTAMYAKTSVKMRSLPSTDGDQLGMLSGGQEITVTGKCVETGWYRIKTADGVAYVSNNYVVADKPSTSTVQASNTGKTGTTQSQANTGNNGTAQAQGTTTSQQPVASAKTDDTAESCTSAFLELLNADRRAAGLSDVSAGSGSLEAQALKRAKELTSSPAQSLGGGATFESVGATNGTDVASAYSIFKQTSGTWSQLMDENLENVSLARCGTMWALEGYVKANVVIIDANHPAPDDSSSIPEIPQVPDEELELKSSTDSTDTYGSSNVEVADPEEDAAVTEQWGWDW